VEIVFSLQRRGHAGPSIVIAALYGALTIVRFVGWCLEGFQKTNLRDEVPTANVE
jgi:hypothetical protein